MANRVIAGVMPVDIFTADGQTLICTAEMLTKEGIQIGSEADDVRGGDANHLIAKYYHNSKFTVQLQSATFSLEYLALKVGGNISVSAQIEDTEEVTVTAQGKIKVAHTPVAGVGTSIIGFYKYPNESNDTWKAITINASTKEATADVKVGDVVCVKYFHDEESARKLVIPANIIPSRVLIIGRVPQFAVSEVGVDASAKTQIGEMQIKVPTLALDPAGNLEVTSSGHATLDINGEALVSYENSCSGKGYYAVLTERTYEGDMLDNAQGIFVVNSNNEDITVGEKVQLKVMANYGGLTMPSEIPASKLTFVSKDQAVATVSESGEITAVGAGNTNIEVTATSKPSLSAVASVEVIAGH